MRGAAMRTPESWFDAYSWGCPPEQATTETDNIPQADDAPQPGSRAYLELGCDDLYVTLGGEG
jgi:hypothetical protein